MNKIVFLALAYLVLIFTLSREASSQHLPVKVGSDDQLQFPWAGGLNSCQFGEIDMNGNGVKDLFVFDRQGNRVLCFLNDGIRNEISYTYAPEYIDKFPPLFEWVIVDDYDGDGREDIFTYSPNWAGIQVYRNVTKEELAFEKVVFPYLTSFQGGGHVNILATNANYPAIVDLDGDGDLDILTFWALGTYIQQHTNQSMEKYGHADSLDYVQTEYCWGRVGENEENNIIYLDTCFFKHASADGNGGFRHRGATLRVLDLNNSGLPDLIIGDVDYPGLTQLINGGTTEDAFMVSQDTAFPSYDVPVRLFSMPVTAMIDVNNNGLKDMIVSPFDPSPIVSENKQSVWLYLNEGTLDQPVFRLHTKSFLQDQMIDLGSGAYPLLYDVNQNGMLDLVAGNYGYYIYSWYEFGMLKSRYISQLAYYENVGEPNAPVFQLMDNDLAGLSSLGLRGLVPAMVDLSGNGLPDLLVGNERGSILFIEQTEAGIWVLRDEEFAGIDVGSWSAPQLFDLDGDGVVDLIIGSRNGKLTYYKGAHNGESIEFQYVTDVLGRIDVTDFTISYDGYSTPCAFRTSDGKLFLAVGSEQGKIFLFDEIEENLPNGSFREIDQLGTLLDTLVQGFDMGMRSAAYLTDLFNDGSLAMIAGNYSGGLQLFNASAEVLPGMAEYDFQIDFNLFPNPATESVGILFSDPAQTEVEIRIYDLKSLLVKRLMVTPGSNSVEVSLKGLPKGLYIIELKDGKRVGIKKLIKL